MRTRSVSSSPQQSTSASTSSRHSHCSTRPLIRSTGRATSPLADTLAYLAVFFDRFEPSEIAATVYSASTRHGISAMVMDLPQVVDHLCSVLGQISFDHCVTAGAAMEPADAVAYARTDPSRPPPNRRRHLGPGPQSTRLRDRGRMLDALEPAHQSIATEGVVRVSELAGAFGDDVEWVDWLAVDELGEPVAGDRPHLALQRLGDAELVVHQVEEVVVAAGPRFDRERTSASEPRMCESTSACRSRRTPCGPPAWSA